ncbi:MAG TPA: hypothetical protein VF458_11270 [Ktedonobacteraceae bacterium]
MGGSHWSTDAYEEAELLRKKAGKSAFAYSDSARATGKWTVHPTLDPKGVTFRESRDSDEHPRSNAIAVFFDETGSMKQIPHVFQKKLAELMSLLLVKGYIQDPQILFGAFGDAVWDRVPLQVGQFESGVEMDEHLRNVILEGNGGGGGNESYELPLYFLARHTSIDCWEKRGRKGYAFLIGDEKAYAAVNKEQVAKLIGDDLPESIPLRQVIAEVQRSYHLFFIFPSNGSYAADGEHPAFWKDLLGQNVIILEDENAVSETIALTIGLTEKAVDLAEGKEDLSSAGASAGAIDAAARALQVYASAASISSVAGVALPGMDPSTGSGGTERL